MKTVGLAEVLLYHQKIVHRTGGTMGIRDIGLIESALSSSSLAWIGANRDLGVPARLG